jgi:hypothetical protein
MHGFIARAKAISRECCSSHCIIHCHAAVVKKIPNALKMVLDNVVKIVNVIKSRLLNSRIFTAFFGEMSSSYTMLLLHTHFQWLS